jgi:hypothetical protein
MHRRTYKRLTEELHAARALHRVIFEVGASAVLARLAKSDTLYLRILRLTTAIRCRDQGHWNGSS